MAQRVGVWFEKGPNAPLGVHRLVPYPREARADDSGRPNPVAGRIDRAYATGFSQTARFLRTFLTQGYNAVDGRQVFAGLHLHAGGAGQMPILEAGKGERSATASPTPNFLRPDLRGIQEPPFTYAEIVAAQSGIGFVIWAARRYMHTNEVMAGVVVIGAIGLVTDQLLRLLHRRLFRYL